jgi:hypothetical protein
MLINISSIRSIFQREENMLLGKIQYSSAGNGNVSCLLRFILVKSMQHCPECGSIYIGYDPMSECRFCKGCGLVVEEQRFPWMK